MAAKARAQAVTDDLKIDGEEKEQKKITAVALAIRKAEVLKSKRKRYVWPTIFLIFIYE